MRPSRRSRADAASAWGGGSIILEITNTFTIKNAAWYAFVFLCISKEYCMEGMFRGSPFRIRM